ncbi:NAD(P)H-dependent oxidoreductase [Sulfurimonas sp. C5]|uniref:NAD(P)H-dependent oxidoreductase n=1 Tax=Sulfurimonas sp. C5 TaxID=3036947 RepID=UPI002456DB70|nr:NAD(P)H-dependent oxidoreductase [Sulfurimonas sp. C5]MDH4944892.1 NAD(P)H-dependent oxidoreductase [Sulfurimonas sp. C5]
MENIKQTLLDAYNFRHACKLFDATKKINDEDFNFILETARLSPTSFGMEGVRLTVITNEQLKKDIKPFCWNQNQIDSCSHLVIFKTRTKDLKPYSEWVKDKFSQRKLPKEAQEKYMQVYENFHKSLKSDDIYEWGTRQAYIMFSSMITSAALIGIDSCPIEGFEKEALEQLLSIDTNEEEISLVCTFGYRENPQPQKFRLNLEDMCEFKK